MSDTKKRVYQYLEEHQQELAEFLSKMIQFDTQNFGPHGPAVEAEAQEWLYGEFEKEGLITEKLAYDEAGERPNICGTLKGAGGGKDIMFHAHMDTGSIDEHLDWKYHPLSGHIDEELNVWGRGAVDDKGGIAAAFFAAKAIKECGIKLKGDVKVTSAVAEEECEGDLIGTGAVVRNMEKKPDLTISCEGTEMDFELCGSTMTRFEMIIEGNGPFIACQNQGLYPQHHSMPCGDQVFIDPFAKALPIIEMLQRKARDWNLNFRHPVWGAGGVGGLDTNGLGLACINLCMIQGGMLNCSILPNLSIHFRVNANPDWSIEKIQKEITDDIMAIASTDSWLKEHPPILKWGTEVSYIDWPGHYLPMEHEYTQLCAGVFEELFDRKPVYSTGRCNDDAGWIAQYGVPAFTVGASGAARMHNVNEFIEIPRLCEAAKLYAGIMMEFCEIDE